MKGIFTALMASFDKYGTLYEEGLRSIVHHNIYVQKVDGLYVGGSTGENFMLSTEEKKRIFEIVKEEGKGKVHLIGQVGSPNLKEAAELGNYVTKLGYDAVSAVTPFYYKFSFDEVKNYYQTIAEASNNKLIIYTIPMFTGLNMTLDQFDELFNIENVIGVKFTDTDLLLLERLRLNFPNNIIYSGFDELLLPCASLGVDGTIGSTYNINGIRARKVFDLVQNGQISQARRFQHECNDIITELLKENFFQSLKEMLKIQGVDAGLCRKPFSKISQKRVDSLKLLNTKYF
jgi:N-acetylneuraminate lyase